MRTPRLPDGRPLVIPALAGIALALLVGADGVRHVAAPAAARTQAAWRGLVGSPRAQIPLGQRMIVVLKAPSLGQRVAGGTATESQERAWTAAALATQAQLLAFLAANGAFVQPEFRYARVLNGFSAPLDPRAIGILERSPAVRGIYPVRAAYPASLVSSPLLSPRFAPGQGRRPDVELAGYDGRGVTIALLDTGVDGQHPYLRDRVELGYDLVSAGGDGTFPGSNPEDPAQLERHGTEIAGLLAGHDGPSGLHGVAAGATVLPIRVAGWQPDAAGHFSVYARTDQLIAGLERAVDPNADGDGHDAARIALVPLSIPFAAFTDSPEALAVDGASGLDTLVVLPAGNDGEAGPVFGSIGGPGGASSALTVGATDARADLDTVRVVFRRGLEVLLSRDVPLLGAIAPRQRLNLRVAAVRGRGLFDARGFSLVAGKAALVAAGGDPAGRARAAARAGAAAVVLYGDRLPAGGLGVDEQLRVPVISVPAAPALALLAAREAGFSVGVSIGRAKTIANPARGGIAAFSSRGLAFDGRLKPELAAPGVELATSEPEGSYGTINGSSAAAAVVAGAAALLVQARPSADAAALRGLLVGSGHTLAGQDLDAQGAGLVDVGAAAAAEVVGGPTAVGFGVSTGKGWLATRTITVRNVSSRRLRVQATPVVAGGESALLGIKLSPRRFVLKQGQERRVAMTLRVAGIPGDVPLEGGSIVIAPEGGRAVHVPWAVAFQRRPGPLVSAARLSRRSFAPSDRSPTLLSFSAGRVDLGGRAPEVQPVRRLDVRLLGLDGATLGVIARLRDILPGRYAFGLTGRDPQGTQLPPGQYRIQLIAWPVLGGKPTRLIVRFTIE